MSSLLVVDDDAALCRSLEIGLSLHGHRVESAPTMERGLALCDRMRPDLALVDLKLPDGNGLDLLAELTRRHPGLRVVLVTGEQDMKTAIEAMKAGAFDYVRKPFDIDEMLVLIEKARLRDLQERGGEAAAASGDAAPERSIGNAFEIVGSDRSVIDAIKQIGLFARSGVAVLIEGESGTGKELIARALHEAGSPGRPFVAINCSGVVATLLESELFGHEKGAFTNALVRKEGKLEHAADGTVLFDEIGDMPLELQAKLLRVLQEREFTRVGGLAAIPFRARVVSATNRDLERMAREGKFREDLFYRIAASRLSLPPLRQRRGDIPLLVPHLLAKIGARLSRPAPRVTRDALDRLIAHDYPGNVRELENLLARAAAVARGDTITPDDLAIPDHAPIPPRSTDPPGAPAENYERAAPDFPTPPGAPAIATLAAAERVHVAHALAAFAWNITRTARALDISPTTLRKKIADYDLLRTNEN